MSSLYELPDVLDVPAQPARPRLSAVPDVPLDFDAVVRTLTPRLQRYATRRLGDRHEAEELVQEALLRAYDHRAELATEDDVAAWTTCVTGRLVIDRLRVRGRSTCVAEVPEGTRIGRDTADVVVARDEARTALDALDAMPPRQAAVLWAREVEGLAYEAIGERFGMTEPAVRSVLSRARKALRKEYATRGGTLPAAGLVALAPWIDGLTWADRLRRVASRAAAPAVVGAVGLGVLTGAVVAPWSGPADASPGSDRVVAAVATRSAPVAAPQALAAPAAAPAAAAPAQPAPAPPPVRAAAPVAPPVVSLDRLDEGCVDASGATAGVRSCDEQSEPTLQIGPDLPETPLGIHRLGVEGNVVDCRDLPVLPLTQCTAGEGTTR